jgi:hypothetical protein
MASSTNSGVRRGESSRTPSRPPAKRGAEDLAAGLLAKMGDLLLTEKEATRLVIKGVAPAVVPRPR